MSKRLALGNKPQSGVGVGRVADPLVDNGAEIDSEHRFDLHATKLLGTSIHIPTFAHAAYWSFRTLVAVATPVLLFGAPAAAGSTWGNVAMKEANPQVGCAYEVNSGSLYRLRAGDQARDNFAGGGIVVTFFDDGATIGVGRAGTDPNGWGQAKVSWTPKTAGQHLLTAQVEGSNGPTPLDPLTVQVRPATNTGSFGCFPGIFG